MALLGQLLRHWEVIGRRAGARRLGALVALLALTGCGEKSFAQAPSREYQIKAVLLYNLTQFVEWPKSAFTTNDVPFVIGILGVDPFGTLLEDAVRGESYNNRQIIVKHFEKMEEAKNCQMLFISSSERNTLPTLLPKLNGLPILTVADYEGFIRAGGMINIYKTLDNKIRLKINVTAAKANDLAVSAKLLRVSVIVRPEED